MATACRSSTNAEPRRYGAKSRLVETRDDGSGLTGQGLGFERKGLAPQVGFGRPHSGDPWSPTSRQMRASIPALGPVAEILAEEGNARVWGGMHWRHSTEVGTKLGSRVGKYTATHLLKPLDD